MDAKRKEFFEDLLATANPSGFERSGQRVWVDYVSEYADEVSVDSYGNAVAALHGESDLEVALVGHSDEIGFIVRNITDDGFIQIDSIGTADATVSRGQHVRIHSADGPVSGVIGQTPVHVRDSDADPDFSIKDLYIDIGAADGEEAETMVDRGDPVTVSQTVSELTNGRFAARGMDNRIGIWAAAEGLRRASEQGTDATVYAVSTVQEEVGIKGASMVAFDLEPDVAIAIDVTHATDSPEYSAMHHSGVELGGGPAIARGSANHPKLVNVFREIAANDGINVQLMATGNRTATDADAFYTSRGGIPSLNVGLPNRYMHTPVEVIDSADLDSLTELLAAFTQRAHEFAPFEVSV